MRKLKHTLLVTATLIACISCGGDGQSSAPPAEAAATAPSATTRISDTDAAIIYSRGNATTQDWISQQNEHSSNLVRSGGAVTGVGVVVNFSGTGITWIGKKASSYGIATYSIDGGTPQTVDNYNSTEIDQSPLVQVAGLTSESHVLAISLLDQKNAAASDYWQSIDAFNINGSTLTASQGTVAGYNSPDLKFSGKWGGGMVSDGSDLSGGHYWSNVANSSVAWTFVGSLIEVFGRPDYENGYMDVYIDSNPNPVASINTHFGMIDDDSLNSDLLYAGKLAPGQHTIKLVVSGKKDSSARDIYLQFDEFVAFE
jgi:hypothetical protein